MKVVFLQDVRGVGRRFDVKDVNDGYARNFLIPKKLAAPATKEAMAKKTEHDTSKSAETAKYKKMAEQLANDAFLFALRADEKGNLFSGVRATDIAKALRDKGYSGEPDLPHPIKTIGAHEVAIRLGRGISAKTKIKITAQ